jgi:hypothetical protein
VGEDNVPVTRSTRGPADPERTRLAEADAGTAEWREWGPYVAERAWGGVREDYSASGDAWASFPFEHARSRTYRWNEDGLSAWSDEHQHVCLGIALWNGADPFLKERYFGLSGPQGNHGEDVKDYWWYVDATPTHSFHRTRYAYPLREFPYDDLVRTNASRDRRVGEYELIDTGTFDGDEYAMVTCDWAKAGPRDILLTIDVHNRSDHEATVHVLPTVWFRNTWSWDDPAPPRPRLWADGPTLRGHHEKIGDLTVVSASEPALSAGSVTGTATAGVTGTGDLHPAGSVTAARSSDSAGTVGAADGSHPADPVTATAPPPARLLFCENETNVRGLYGTSTWAGRPATPYPKDGINDHVTRGTDSVNPAGRGTKAAFHHVFTIPAGEHARIRVRLTCDRTPGSLTGEFDDVMARRERESDLFWDSVFGHLPAERAHVARQAMAGLLSSKQYYPYDVRRWLTGDPAQPPPAPEHATGRNAAWWHMTAQDLILMPDPWEYPWFASWDLSFHCVALALVDPAMAKDQLLLLLHEWYMHPSGDIPAYEWNFDDANPPVQAWAARQIFDITGGTDTVFLERVMHKLLLNFTWWVNRKDAEGNNVFEGGFLGLDNIGPIDRSAALPLAGVLEQSDGTAWMAMYCLDMLRMAVALARDERTYDDLAVKFLDHFCYISTAANNLGLWDEQDGFYYDHVRSPDGHVQPVRIRSVVGLMPLAAVAGLDDRILASMPALADRLDWLRAHRPDLTDAVHFDQPTGTGLLAMVGVDRLELLLRVVLDPAEFLSDHGLRSVSAAHRDHPAEVRVDGQTFSVDYEPAESRTPLFGGNSNWRGPVWFPINTLMISALRRYDAHLAGQVRVEHPTGSGRERTLAEVADDLSDRLMSLFLPGPDGERPCQAGLPWQQDVLFNEYFHGDTGAGLGATHQTGWTAMIAALALGWPR